MFAETIRQAIFVTSASLLFLVAVFMGVTLAMNRTMWVGLRVLGICLSAVIHPLIFYALITDKDGISLVSAAVLLAVIDIAALTIAVFAFRACGRVRKRV